MESLARDVAQLLLCLPSIHEGLNFNMQYPINGHGCNAVNPSLRRIKSSRLSSATYSIFRDILGYIKLHLRKEDKHLDKFQFQDKHLDYLLP